MTNYKREEIGPSGYTVVKPSSQSYMDSYNYQSYQQQQQQYQQQQSYVLKSNSLSNFSHKIDDRHEAIKKALPPLPTPSPRPLIKERLSKAFDERPPLSRRPSQKLLSSDLSFTSQVTSRRPSISSNSTNPYEFVTNRSARPFSASYDFQSAGRSVRSSPSRDLRRNSIHRDTVTPSRRSSIVDAKRLPWPEPSPVRELPPQAPKIKVKHYPLPPPSYAEGMIAVSKRLRNRSASPAPNYAELELGKRPALIPAAIGRPSPSREMIRMTVGGPPLKYHYGRYI